MIMGVGCFIDKLMVEMYCNGDQLQVDFGKVSLIFFDLLLMLLVVCIQLVSNDLVMIFDVFWYFFNEYYVYFDQCGVDWNVFYVIYCLNLDGFFVGCGKLNDIIFVMLCEIGDGYVNLYCLFGDEDFGIYLDWIDDLDGNVQIFIV